MVKRTYGWMVAGALSALSMTTAAQGWSSMRCGNDLVNVGDSLYEVVATCGQADQVDEYTEYRTERVFVRRACRDDGDGDRVCRRIYRERTIEVPMHRLTYDFGKNRFIHYLTFERGRLRHVESGSYGKKPPAPG